MIKSIRFKVMVYSLIFAIVAVFFDVIVESETPTTQILKNYRL